jgi:hypothetical protein
MKAEFERKMTLVFEDDEIHALYDLAGDVIERYRNNSPKVEFARKIRNIINEEWE